MNELIIFICSIQRNHFHAVLCQMAKVYKDRLCVCTCVVRVCVMHDTDSAAECVQPVSASYYIQLQHQQPVIIRRRRQMKAPIVGVLFAVNTNIGVRRRRRCCIHRRWRRRLRCWWLCWPLTHIIATQWRCPLLMLQLLCGFSRRVTGSEEKEAIVHALSSS